MLRPTAALAFGLALSLLVSASTRVNALDGVPLGDQPAPTSPPLAFNEPSPSFTRGFVPVNTPSAGSQRRLRRKTLLDRLDNRQTQCAGFDYILVCPTREDLPCCRPGFPVCCHDQSDICCPSGTFCQGVKTCCPSGSIGCGEGCCDAGTTCCGTKCCVSGWTCQNGACVNTQLSTVSSVRSVRSVRSVVSIPFESLLRESSASVSRVSASLSSKVATQDHGDANPDTVNTALVLPSDPRIEYDSAASWVDTAHDNGIGSCANGTKVANVTGASFTFVFSGSSVSIQTAAHAGLVNYTVIIDEKRAVASDRTQAPNECYIVTSFTQSGLYDVPHTLKVVGGSGQAGKLEFAGIIYTGKGAFGTRTGAGYNRAAVVGGAIGGSIGFLLLVALGFGFWIRHRYKKKFMMQQQQKQSSIWQLGSSLGAPPANQGSNDGSYESIPGTAGHEQPALPAQRSPTSPLYPASPGASSGTSGKNGKPSSGGSSRRNPPLVQPAVPPSTPPGVISPVPRVPSAVPLPSWVERARNIAASPSQNTCTIEGSNSGPNPAAMQEQPQADANVGASGPRPGLQRPQSIHDPRYYTAADFYGLSPLPQSPFNGNGS